MIPPPRLTPSPPHPIPAASASALPCRLPCRLPCSCPLGFTYVEAKGTCFQACKSDTPVPYDLLSPPVSPHACMPAGLPARPPDCLSLCWQHALGSMH